MRLNPLKWSRSALAALALVGVTAAAFATSSSVTFPMVLAALERTSGLAFSNHPTLEQGEPDEAASIMSIASSMFQIQMATEPQSRDAHAKGHVCAAAEFSVDGDVPQPLRAGLFANSGKLDAIVRFSNGSGTTKPDGVPDGRGIAIKVLNGAPNGNLIGTGTTQDFLLINSPNFFIRSVADYALFEQIILTQRDPKAFFLYRAVRESLAAAGRTDAETLDREKVFAIVAGIAAFETNPTQLQTTLVQLFGVDAGKVGAALSKTLADMKTLSAPLELSIARSLAKAIGSSATEPYFSMSSYLLKAPTGDTGVKYVVRPMDCSTEKPIDPLQAPAQPSGPDFLREELAARLSNGDVCFRFFLQPLPEGADSARKRQLVEDSRLDYGTSEIAVARLRIPKQETLGAGKAAYCENLSFNPWQARPEHQPIGSMNRARKWAVTASSIRRHLVRGAERSEPTGIEELRAK